MLLSHCPQIIYYIVYVFTFVVLLLNFALARPLACCACCAPQSRRRLPIVLCQVARCEFLSPRIPPSQAIIVDAFTTVKEEAGNVRVPLVVAAAAL